ncbi:nuclear transport factor 2 family protein [Candidatus Synechococcus calcipolaris G9]|uniref:Nuclear transport factor 2 family protein n=1 Tax=Candidatus Synechococcus calcipolaris G9 TaxID=1497997 RepID=A0ABT6EYI8_9SYNE|nr:nuclear transport factor 2 family protein [Candidatus Synechococcus calcipolaris]MDG2990853.1 nuclear transport factor 2 family protein [Candidatus Synechococcus calcipolaris G9]
MSEMNALQIQVHAVLENWAKATRQNRKDEILKNHVPDLVIFDVLSPMKYESAESYRQSWDSWQPETQGDGQFELENLSVTVSTDLAFAHCFIRCGGKMPDGHTFQDLVRATFCLKKIDEAWKIVHQHISKPIQQSGS